MTKPKGQLDALLDGLGIKLVPVYRRFGPYSDQPDLFDERRTQ